MVKTSLVEAFDDRDVIAQIQKLDKTVKDQEGIASGAVAAAEEARDAARDTSERFAESVGAVVDEARQAMAQSRGDVAEIRSIVAAETEAVGRIRTQTIALQETVNSTRDEVQRQAGIVEQTNRNAVVRSGTEIPQVISGSGGLQVAGDMSVGGDLTVTESGHIHMDASDIEVAGMAIEKSGRTTVMSNEGGISFAEDTPVSFGRVPKLGSDSTGNANRPIFLDAGVPKAMTSDVIDASVTAQTKAGPLTVGVSLGVEGVSSPGLNITATTNAFGHVLYTNRDGKSSSLEFTGNGIRRMGDVTDDAHPTTLVTKADVFTGSGSGANNLLHTIGNEVAEGFKTVNVATSQGSIASMSSSAWTVIVRLGQPGPGSSNNFPIFFTTRYIGFIGVGHMDSNGNLVLKGIRYGDDAHADIRVAHADDGFYLVARRNTSSGQSIGVFMPWRTQSAGIYEGAAVSDSRTLDESVIDRFLDPEWRLIE